MESDTDAFAYVLAEKLGKTVAEIRGMEYAEYVGWQAYYEVKAAMGGVRK